MGAALSIAGVSRGWVVSLLMGPGTVIPGDARVRLQRFRTTSDLQSLLHQSIGTADILIMAAAVSDYRPRVDPAFFGGKFRRKSEALHLTLEPTPDLLAEVAQSRRPGQLLVGFALEPRADLTAAALEKMHRKRIDMVVANPLETMDSEHIEATVFSADGSPPHSFGPGPKPDAALWLTGLIDQRWRSLQAESTSPPV